MSSRPGSDSVARYRAAFAQRDLVHEIEALAARAWPPLTLVDLDGWQLRSAGGLSRRANSAWPRSEGRRLGLDARLAQLEAFYLQGGLDPAVQISPSARPRDLEGTLAQRGYRPLPPVEVRTRRVDLLPGRGDGAGLVPVERWLPVWARAAGAPDRHLVMASRMLERTLPPAVYALVEDEGEVAVARGVLDGGWLGIDLLAATAGLQTPAAGAALADALGRWAVRGGGEHAFCEVDSGERGASALSAGLGFRRAYTYRFVVKPRALARR